jgi:hypothetical protein
MSRDVKGYYALLEVQFDASAHEIKSAYRRLAKIHHPDVNTAADGGHKFRAINEAFDVLSDPDARARYDSESITNEDRKRSAGPRETIDPITCDSCHQVTAQPRYVMFRYVISVILATYRNPIQGMYCSACARKAAWKANIITGLFGWWGAPWGPIYTIADGIKNALGGTHDPRNNERMLWHNALAFASRGDAKLAFALSEKVARSPITEVAERAEKFLDFFKSRGIDYTGVSLNDPWQQNQLAKLGQLAAIASLPAALTITIAMSESSSKTDGPWTSYRSPSAYVPAETASQVVAQTQPTNVPVCKKQIENGERLDGKMSLQKSGHVLEIDNGSGGDAIVKVRNYPSQKLAVSFFIASNQEASLKGLRDGQYTIQYAFGNTLAEDCRSFTDLSSAGAFPGVEELQTTEEIVSDGVMVSHQRLSYTLYSVPSGNVHPQTIDASMFNAD